MAKAATSAFIVAALLVAAEARTTTTPAPLTGVWDAYPASLLPVCPHIPRHPVDFDKLNGRWFVVEKGGHAHPETLCDLEFQLRRGQNLTLHVGLRAFNDGNPAKHYNSIWKMTEDNAWRDSGRQYMFVGYSTNRALLVICTVDFIGDNEPDGYSLALSKEPSVRSGDLSLGRLRGYPVLGTNRSECPGE